MPDIDELEDALQYPAGPDLPAVDAGEFADFDADPTVGDPGEGIIEIDPEGDDD